jgi:hypothetical protein
MAIIDVRSMKLVTVTASLRLKSAQVVIVLLFLRNGVFSTTAPGVATPKSFNSHPGSCPDSVMLDRFQRVLRATGREPAAAKWTQQHIFQRRNHPPV